MQCPSVLSLHLSLDYPEVYSYYPKVFQSTFDAVIFYTWGFQKVSFPI
jgi:hypothetical protein